MIFILGTPAQLRDTSNVDWIPSVNLPAVPNQANDIADIIKQISGNNTDTGFTPLFGTSEHVTPSSECTINFTSSTELEQSTMQSTVIPPTRKMKHVTV